MSRGTTTVLFALLAAARAGGAADAKVADPLAAASATIKPEALRAHVTFLADDLLEGRGTATRGHEIAAHYVAAQFEAMGLEPAGTGGGWFQKVPLRRAELVGERSTLALTAGGQTRELVAGRDFVMMPDELREQSEVAAPVVYVGFGISAPERGHDDYAGTDVRGKVVALLMGAPASFPNDQRAYYSSRQLKAETAAARGAVGLLLVLSPDEEKRFPFARIAGMVQAGIMSWLDERGNPDGAPEGLRGQAILSREGAGALFTGSPRPLDDVFKDAAAAKAGSVALPVDVRLLTESRHTTVESPNVLGMLRGSDPVLSKEYVVLSAHVDHLGIGPARDGDSIYNGSVVNEAAGRLGLAVSPDPFPEEVVFIRGDHYAFVRRGVPAVTLSCGLESADPKIDGGPIFRQWLATVYHSPKDDLAQPMDFESAAKIVRLYFLMADQIAETAKRPTWNPGDFFGARFAR